LAAAVDSDAQALKVVETNLSPVHALEADMAVLFEVDASVGTPTKDESAFIEKVGEVDLLVGGPPCQGNSNLNNRTRRTDQRNLLYGRMVRAALVTQARAVLIENVPSVRRAAQGVVADARKDLTDAGYTVADHVVDSTTIGVPQGRRRHLLLAVHQDLDVNPADILNATSPPCPLHHPRTVEWAIADLEATARVDDCGSVHIDSPSKLSAANAARIDWLFDNDAYDLPNYQRPTCHQGNHTYVSMYGRLRWDHPAQTVTSGFGSPGQGRYVHPRQRRTLTPHEAARLQTFPDWFDFTSVPSRSSWARMIGNAVPPLLNAHLTQPLLLSLGMPAFKTRVG
jgi:DNA (cytosine-5)-methyltransferase 1